MKDFPLFTTEFGAASITLREIPYQKKAYIKIQSTETPAAFLEECAAFCRMAGAEQIYATGHPYLEQFPLHTALVHMQCSRDCIQDTDAALFPVQEKTLPNFLEIYNRKVLHIPNAAYMTRADGEAMTDGYFIHRGGQLLGIGRVSGNCIRFLASVMPGMGMTVIAALAHAITDDIVTLEAATANAKAMALYEKMGFLTVQEISRWYAVK